MTSLLRVCLVRVCRCDAYTCIFRIDIVDVSGDDACVYSIWGGHTYSLCRIIEVEDHSKEAYL
jgi:hypothetical protein